MAPYSSSQRERALAPRDYSRALRSALVLCAVLLAILPVPVTALRLLPAYDIHARFLIFYAPVVCFLILAYLLYVRDGLARLMFADILRPIPEHDSYYRERPTESAKRWLRRLQASLLALLPAVLLATSFYCMIRYTARLRQSVEISAAAMVAPLVDEEVAFAGSEPPPSVRPPDSSARRPATAETLKTTAVPDSAPHPDAPPDRGQLLRTASIDSIPLFTELTVLYIGIFASALIAVLLMALKEYAKEAMGLTEQDLVLGDWGAAGPVREDAPMRSPPDQ